MRHDAISYVRALALVALGACAACGGSAHREGASPSESTPAPGTAAISGTTLDAATGAPLAGVEVEGPGGAKALSDTNGRFVLEGLSEGATGELVAHTKDGRSARNELRPLANARLEVVLHLR